MFLLILKKMAILTCYKKYLYVKFQLWGHQKLILHLVKRGIIGAL